MPCIAGPRHNSQGSVRATNTIQYNTIAYISSKCDLHLQYVHQGFVRVRQIVVLLLLELEYDDNHLQEENDWIGPIRARESTSAKSTPPTISREPSVLSRHKQKQHNEPNKLYTTIQVLRHKTIPHTFPQRFYHGFLLFSPPFSPFPKISRTRGRRPNWCQHNRH